MGLFAKGYKAVDEEKKRQENRRSLFRFFITGDGAEADIRFLTDNPITFYEHTLKTQRNGKEVYDNVVCPQNECKLCEGGDRPSFKGAYLIWDEREFEATVNGKKKKVKGSLKLYVAGTKVLSQIQRLYGKYGLLDRQYTVVRLGEGQNTTYTFEMGDKLKPLSEETIKEMLPENLRKLYDGSTDSLYDIIEKVLESDLPQGASVDDDDEDDSSYDRGEADEEYENQLIGVDDEEEEPPKRPSLKKPKSGSSTKSILKARNR